MGNFTYEYFSQHFWKHDNHNGVPFLAYHQISSCREGQQEGGDGSQRHGEVVAVPDIGRDPLPSRQLGPPQRSREISLTFFYTDRFSYL